MKSMIYMAVAVMAVLVASSCEKEYPNGKNYQNYPDGYDKQYYTAYDYVTDDQGNPVMANRTISAEHDSKELIELPIKFMSETERNYDIEVRLYVRNSAYFLEKLGVKKTPGQYSTPDSLALPGIDFRILDQNKNVMAPVQADTLTYYSLVFPKAHKGVRTLYVEMLGNEDYDNVRSAWFSLAINPIDVSTEASLKKTAINHDAGKYLVYSVSRSYYRRLDIR